uniref:Chlorophyll a-b binding proteinic n=1 Tax=Rhizophora mucronata TaxID=61149 RepID=A0A2P2JU55_RHIMU
MERELLFLFPFICIKILFCCFALLDRFKFYDFFCTQAWLGIMGLIHLGLERIQKA